MSDAQSYFETVYEQTYNDLMKYAVIRCDGLDDAHDVLQNAYTAFYRRVLKNGSGDIANPQAYLMRLVRHELGRQYGIFALRRKSVPVFSSGEDENYESMEMELSREYDDFTRLLEDKDAVGRILEELKKDESVWKIFVLHFLGDMKLDEIAEELGIPLSSVKNRLYRTLKKLRATYCGKEE